MNKDLRLKSKTLNFKSFIYSIAILGVRQVLENLVEVLILEWLSTSELSQICF